MNKKTPWYDNIEKAIIIALFAIMTIILFVNVVTRFGFGYTASWTEQTARILFCWVTFAGVSLAAMAGAHLQVTAITMIIGEEKGKKVFLFGDIVCIVFGLFLAYKIFVVMMNTITMKQTFPAIPWLPTWVMYLPGVLGMIGFVLRIIQRNVRDMKAKKEEVK